MEEWGAADTTDALGDRRSDQYRRFGLELNSEAGLIRSAAVALVTPYLLRNEILAGPVLARIMHEGSDLGRSACMDTIRWGTC